MRGTPSSATPDQAAQAVVESLGGQVPGNPDVRQNWLEGLGPLSGFDVGLGVSALTGLARAFGLKVPIAVAPVVVGLAATAVSDGVMTAVKVTNPRSWTVSSVVNDVDQHLAYGSVTVLALQRLLDPHTLRAL